MTDPVLIFCDGACSGNPGPGGFGSIIRAGKNEKELSGGELLTTNNRMELTAAIVALEALKRPCLVIVTSDSQYLVKGMTEWVHGWAGRGWRRSGGEIENLPLWKELVDAATPHGVQWQWVRGHAGHPQNEYANDLAVDAARTQSSSDGSRTSEFDAWLDIQRAKKRVQVDPAPFPIGKPFAAARPLPRTASRA